MPGEQKQLWGKYRARVVDDADPLALGRLLVEASTLPDLRLSWAMPCVPWPGVAGLSTPPVGTNVWIEFESGDPDYPIWSGCFWTLSESPVLQQGDD
ncbi:MAG: hypothetical protein KA105_09910 [Caulobacter sp.]|nr:hypothetical protein [Caulobacter sp.]